MRTSHAPWTASPWLPSVPHSQVGTSNRGSTWCLSAPIWSALGWVCPRNEGHAETSPFWRGSWSSQSTFLSPYQSLCLIGLAWPAQCPSSLRLSLSWPGTTWWVSQRWMVFFSDPWNGRALVDLPFNYSRGYSMTWQCSFSIRFLSSSHFEGSLHIAGVRQAFWGYEQQVSLLVSSGSSNSPHLWKTSLVT